MVCEMCIACVLCSSVVCVCVVCGYVCDWMGVVSACVIAFPRGCGCVDGSGYGCANMCVCDAMCLLCVSETFL